MPGWPGLSGLGRSSCEMHFGENGKAPPEAGLSGETTWQAEGGRESQFINFKWPQPESLIQVLGNASSGLQPGLLPENRLGQLTNETCLLLRQVPELCQVGVARL